MPIPVRDYDRSINSEIERLLYQADVVRQEAEGLVSGLSEAQFRWTPPEGGWSIGQCVEHLNIINALFLKDFQAEVVHGRKEGILSDGPYVYNLIGRWMLRIMQPPVKRKFKAPKVMQPGAVRPMAETMQVFFDRLDEFKDVVQKSNGLDLQTLKVPSPVTSLIRYNLGVAYWIKAAHDRRHLWQAREVRNRRDFPVQ